jgi:apolipoprotein N-acyltransferase
MILALAFPPFGFGPLVWLGLIPWRLCRTIASTARATLCAFCFGMGFFLVGLHWGVATGANHFQVPVPGNWLLALILPAWLALFPALALWLTRALGGPGLSTASITLASASWLVSELLRHHLWGGIPWLELGSVAVDSFLSPALPVIGAAALGALTVFANGVLLLALRSPRRHGKLAISTGLLLLACPLLLGPMEWSRPVEATWRVGLVQAGAPEPDKTPDAESAYWQASARLAGEVSTVIWPEGAAGLLDSANRQRLNRLAARLGAEETGLLIGAQEATTSGHIYNSALLWEPDGQTARYRKQHLFPVLESGIPPVRANWLPPVLADRPAYLAGRDPTPLLVDSNGSHAGVLICWEGFFSREAVSRVKHGAMVLVNMSNEDWGLGLDGLAHNALAARTRAAEVGRPLVRATSTGMTLVADHHGRTMSRIPPERIATLVATVQPRTGQTPFARVGGNMGAGIVAIAILFLALFRGRTSR